MIQARVVKSLDASACAQRNALSRTPEHFKIPVGTIGTVVDQFSDGYLVEFGGRGADRCDWLGVLYASEIEFILEVAKAA